MLKAGMVYWYWHDIDKNIAFVKHVMIRMADDQTTILAQYLYKLNVSLKKIQS